MQKMLLVDQEKCTGCRTCEAVCSAKHEGASNPSRSRIQVVKWEWEGFMMPFMCQQCNDAPCVNACPVKALGRNETLGQVDVDYDRCIGCKLCIAVCPFGGMGYDPIDNKVIKCDFCGVESEAVRRVAVAADYDRLSVKHDTQYACPECSAKKDSERREQENGEKAG